MHGFCTEFFNFDIDMLIGTQYSEKPTAILAALALNVVFVTESADVSKPCLMGETILNEYSIQLAFMPHLSLFLLDLS